MAHLWSVDTDTEEQRVGEHFIEFLDCLSKAGFVEGEIWSVVWKTPDLLCVINKVTLILHRIKQL
jgi:hypothetical protein